MNRFKMRHVSVLLFAPFVCFQNCSRFAAVEAVHLSSNGVQLQAIGMTQIADMNARIDSSGALDYAIQDVCVDGANRPIEGDPTACGAHRNIHIGEKVPYLLTDFDKINQVSYQGISNYPLVGSNGSLKVISSKSMESRFTADFNFSFRTERDAFDLMDVDGDLFSYIRTSDGGCFDQIFSGSSGRQNGWVLFSPNLQAGSLDHRTTIDRVSPDRPAGCEARSSSSGTHTVWNAPAPVNFESGKTLTAIESYHFANKDLGRSNNALEKFYFTREYGFTRWEAWLPLSRCLNELGASRCEPDRADYFLRGRCSSQGAKTTFGGSTWVRVDCRDTTFYQRLNRPLIPIDSAMAQQNGVIDIDSASVFAAALQLGTDGSAAASAAAAAAAVEQARLAEQQRIAAEQAAVAEQARLAQEQTAAQLAAQQAEQARLAEQQRIAAEQARIAQEQARLYEERRAVIENLYVELLGRASDPGGLADYINLLANGVSLETIRGYFLQSPERKAYEARLSVGNTATVLTQPPQGSYQLTCQGVSIASGVLSAICKTMSGRWIWTKLNTQTCNLSIDISNQNGSLACVLK